MWAAGVIPYLEWEMSNVQETVSGSGTGRSPGTGEAGPTRVNWVSYLWTEVHFKLGVEGQRLCIYLSFVY